MFSNNEEKKLDWMYKGPNSMVNREEYLLGRSVDKTLEQLNVEEKCKEQGLSAPPKNHVEHECIPPSIRDYNKIVQSEQVDIAAKLQEDPLVAIRKQEEETRRQFLQNPIQLKKLQKAMKAQVSRKKKHKKSSKQSSSDSDNELDMKIASKLKLFKSDSFDISKKSKKSKDNSFLDTILMHKYNELKSQLSESDMKDILDGKISDDGEICDDDSPHHRSKKNKKKKSRSDSEEKIRKKKKKSSSQKNKLKEESKYSIQDRNSSSNHSISSSKQEIRGSRSDKYKRESRRKDPTEVTSQSYHESPDIHSEDKYGDRKKRFERNEDINKRRKDSKYDHKSNQESQKNRSKKDYKKHRRSSSDSSQEENDDDDRRKRHHKDDEQSDDYRKKNKSSAEKDLSSSSRKDKSKCKKYYSTEKLFQLIQKMSEEKRKKLKKQDSSEEEFDKTISSRKKDKNGSSYSEDSEDDIKSPKKNWGLVKSDGTKIAISGKTDKPEIKKPKASESVKHEHRKQVKRLTNEEKEKIRTEMMQNAVQRDKEREHNLKKYREQEAKDNSDKKEFDKEFIYKELLKSANKSSVESRLKSNINNIQRTGASMDKHFSKRY